MAGKPKRPSRADVLRLLAQLDDDPTWQPSDEDERLASAAKRLLNDAKHGKTVDWLLGYLDFYGWVPPKGARAASFKTRVVAKRSKPATKRKAHAPVSARGNRHTDADLLAFVRQSRATTKPEYDAWRTTLPNRADVADYSQLRRRFGPHKRPGESAWQAALRLSKS